MAHATCVWSPPPDWISSLWSKRLTLAPDSHSGPRAAVPLPPRQSGVSLWEGLRSAEQLLEGSSESARGVTGTGEGCCDVGQGSV